MSNVIHPKHYNTGKIEVIEAIDDWKLGFCEGNVVKYVARAKHKGSELEDLKKARWYLDHAIKKLECTPPATVDAEFEEERVVYPETVEWPDGVTFFGSYNGRRVINLVTELHGAVEDKGSEHLYLRWDSGESTTLSVKEFREAFGKGLAKQEAWLKWDNTVETTGSDAGTTSVEGQPSEAPAKD